MRQRFAVREPNSWVPALLIFGTVLYAAVEVMDRGVSALGFWFFVATAEVGFFLFVFRRNYVELGDGHLTWVKWGHKARHVAFSEIKQVSRKGAIVSILLAKAPALPSFGLFRSKSECLWLAIPVADPEGLTSSVADALRTYGNLEAVHDFQTEEAPVPPETDLVPADRLRRLIAAALDVFVFVSLLCTVALAKTAHLKEGEKPDDVELYALDVAIAWVVYLWIANMVGMSLGKLAFSLRVVHAGTDQAPGPLRGTLRALAALSGYGAALVALMFTPIPIFYIGSAGLAIDFAWSFVDRERRALHDIVAGTRVVQTALKTGDGAV